MRNDNLPGVHHVLRYAARNRLRKVVDEDENEVVIGLTPDAFRLRDGENYLSVTWIEHFSGDFSEQKFSAAKAFRSTYPSCAKLPYKGAFGVGNVERVKSAANDRGHRVRIIHEPNDNPGHSAIRRFPRDDDDLLETLADEVFTEFFLNLDIA